MEIFNGNSDKLFFSRELYRRTGEVSIARAFSEDGKRDASGEKSKRKLLVDNTASFYGSKVGNAIVYGCN
jgi:hypothetical protein